MSRFGDLTQTMCVYELEIDVTNVDYKELSKQLEPKDNIVAINSNFVHKALTGYEEYILKPKKRHVELKTNRYGDCTVFNASIEFTIIVDDEQHVRNIRCEMLAQVSYVNHVKRGIVAINVYNNKGKFIKVIKEC